MSYPMTFKRLINRSGLVDGDYGMVPQRLAAGVNLKDRGLTSQDEFDQLMAPYYRERIESYMAWAKRFAGDLRRLELDAVDEEATCKHIADRTGVDPDVVAIVLKEFMEW